MTNRALVLAALAGHRRHRPRRAAQPGHRSDGRRAARPGSAGRRGRDDELTVAAHGGLRGGARSGLRAGRHRDALPAAAGRAGRRRGPLRRRRAAPGAPDGAVLDALRALGRRIDGDALPFARARHRRVPGGTVRIDASASSQFVSGLLLSGAAFAEGVDGACTTATPVPSLPHIEMTVQMLRRSASTVDDADAEPLAGRARARSRPRRLAVEPDLSNATPFLAAAAVTGGHGHRAGLAGRAPPRPATPSAGILDRDGRRRSTSDDDGLTVTGPRPARTASTSTCTTSAN